ncbi:aminoglycoside phosphotransferase family protein [Candidatus Woesearchaeota archaeon]|nr:aminoglycoside phosphotransferase family protein [Candidatus Woesearchaeota archaeon]
MIDRIREYLQEDVKEQLGLTGGEVEIKELGKGKFNLLYLISTGKTRLVFRLGNYKPHEVLNKKKKEYLLLKKIESTGLGPKPYLLDVRKEHFDSDLEIIEYIEGKELERSAMTSAVVKHIAKRYAALHAIKFKHHGPYPPDKEPPLSLCDEILDDYNRHDLEVLRKDAQARDIIQKFDLLMADAIRILMKRDEKYKNLREFSLLKGDNKLSNIIVNGEQVMFIDWEFAKSGLNLMDIANFLSFAELDIAKTRLFLDTYSSRYGEDVSEDDLHIFTLRDYVLRTVWTLNKVFEHHAMKDLEAFSKSLNLLKRKTEEISKYL